MRIIRFKPTISVFLTKDNKKFIALLRLSLSLFVTMNADISSLTLSRSPSAFLSRFVFIRKSFFRQPHLFI